MREKRIRTLRNGKTTAWGGRFDCPRPPCRIELCDHKLVGELLCRKRSLWLLIKLLLVVLIVLLLFGASRLPSIARAFGQSLGEFKKGLKELEEHPDDKIK